MIMAPKKKETGTSLVKWQEKFAGMAKAAVEQV
jgi:NOL1/NOP2/fmu family ribosome biogenesis protein